MCFQPNLEPRDTKWFRLMSHEMNDAYMRGHSKLKGAAEAEVHLVLQLKEDIPLRNVVDIFAKNGTVFDLITHRNSKGHLTKIVFIDMLRRVPVDLSKPSFLLVCKCQLGRVCHQQPLSYAPADGFDSSYNSRSGRFRFWVPECVKPVWLVRTEFTQVAPLSQVPACWEKSVLLYRTPSEQIFQRVVMVPVKEPNVLDRIAAAINNSLCASSCTGRDRINMPSPGAEYTVRRVENSRLFEAYCVKAKDVKLRMERLRTTGKPTGHLTPNIFGTESLAGDVLDENINETWLFYGCSLSIAESRIVSEGLDERDGAGLSDQCCYFSSKACKASQNNKGTRCLLLCRVILGDQSLGTAFSRSSWDELSRAQRHGASDICDSMRSYPAAEHDEFSLIDGNQIYPGYIVQW
eukprot:GHVS01042018.1.p1 GENE.GHVS01042018.1~~GHVS01042018.1.p1  ORF type:complete len:452 (+),score=6.53 GHVS01042018.1:139-1356(+)